MAKFLLDYDDNGGVSVIPISDNKFQDLYQKGLKDGWNEAKKIGEMWLANPAAKIKEIFGIDTIAGFKYVLKILDELTPNQAIEKIRIYEEKQAKVKIGDIVYKTYYRAVVTGIFGNDVHVVYADGSADEWPIEDCHRTGEYLSEVSELLKQIQTSEDQA